jgi:uncharacterized protein
MAPDSQAPGSADTSQTAHSIDMKPIILFYCVTFAVSVAIALPLWTSGQGLRFPSARLLLSAFLLAPAAGVLAVRLLLPGSIKPLIRSTGLRIGPWRQTFGYWFFAWFGFTLIGLATPFISASFGILHLDLQNFSGYRELLLTRLAGPVLQRYSIQTIVFFHLLSLLIAPLFNGIFTFGEEWGWRGFLLPKLLPLGQWPALVLTGALSGLWHLPVTLLGYDYPFHPKLGMVLMTLFCVVFGTLLGWLRLATDSVWPAVIGHGAMNAVGEFTYVLAAAGQQVDTAQVTILGWSGWILPLLIILLLVRFKLLPVKEPESLIHRGR